MTALEWIVLTNLAKTDLEIWEQFSNLGPILGVYEARIRLQSHGWIAHGPNGWALTAAGARAREGGVY